MVLVMRGVGSEVSFTRDRETLSGRPHGLAAGLAHRVILAVCGTALVLGLAATALGVSHALLARMGAADPWQALHGWLVEVSPVALGAALVTAGVIGVIARRRAGRLLEEEAAVARAIVEQSPHAIVTFAPDGRPATANPAALRLLGERGIERLSADAGETFLFRGAPTSLAARLEGDALCGPGEVMLPDEALPVLVAGDTVQARDGSVLRRFAILVDTRDMVADMRHQMELRHEADRRRRQRERELQRLRLQLQASLAIMERYEPGRPATPADAVELKTLVDDWLDAAVAHGEMAAGGVAHKDLPRLRGERETLGRLFRLILDTVRLRSGCECPTIAVAATSVADGAEITAREADATDADRCPPVAAADDTTLMLGAIAALARGLGGRLAAHQLGDDGNAITVRLPLADRVTHSASSATAA